MAPKIVWYSTAPPLLRFGIRQRKKRRSHRFGEYRYTWAQRIIDVILPKFGAAPPYRRAGYRQLRKGDLKYQRDLGTEPEQLGFSPGT